MAIYGPDFLGLAHPLWPLNASINAISPGSALGVLDCEDTFGRCVPKIRKFLTTGKILHLRSHLHWHPNHTLIPMPKLERVLPEYEVLAEVYPFVHFYISHSLEYNSTSKVEVKRRVDAIKMLNKPNVRPVNCCWRGVGMHLIADLEKHGIKYGNRPRIVSTDGALYGAPHSLINTEEWVNENAYRDLGFIWGARFNFREPGDSNPPPYLERTKVPSIGYIKAHLRLLEPIGTPPTASFPYQEIEKPTLWKAISEDSIGGDNPRENRPCFICREEVDFVRVITHTGEAIGKLPYWDTFTGGMHRYYSGLPGGAGLYGWEFGEKALKRSGSEFVWLKAGEVRYGPVNPAFRCCYYNN